MTAQNVPPTKPASELKLGDHVWASHLIPDLDGIAQVMFVHPYAEYGAEGVTVVLWFGGTTQVESVHVALDHEVQMASAEEIAETRERAERAKRIADIRALVDFLEQHTEIPVAPSVIDAQVNLHGLEGLRTVRDLGARFGRQSEERLDDRTVVRWAFGEVALKVIAWHENGRPGTTCEDLTDPEPALASGRELSAADEATPTGAREPLHTGGMTAGGLVDETEPERCPGCGELTWQIRQGLLGHIPGEPCAPVETLSGSSA